MAGIAMTELKPTPVRLQFRRDKFCGEEPATILRETTVSLLHLLVALEPKMFQNHPAI
jgi:hypothetical protein